MNFLYNLRRVLTRIKQLPARLTRNDNIILGICSILLLIGIIGALVGYHQKKDTVPNFGGEFVEGIVASTVSEVDTQIQDLIYSSLIRFDKDGNIIPELASKYEIADGGKKYIFSLQPGVQASEIISQLKSSEFNLSATDIGEQEGKVAITTSTVYSPLLSDLTKPIFSPGPYIISRRDTREILLKSNKNFILGAPYIDELKIKIYTNKDELKTAFQRGEILAATNIETNSQNYNQYQLALQRYMVLFFNLDRDVVKDKSFRQKIALGQKLDSPITLKITFSDSEASRKYFDDLKEKYTGLNLNIEENIVTKEKLDQEIIPNRDYDILLFGIDYGRDPDPFPFWHSSQISKDGQNLSNFRSKNADKLLEDARLTVDTNERKKKYTDLQKILDDERPAIFLEQNKVTYFVNKKVKGIDISFSITPSDRFQNIWQWYIKTKKLAK